MVVLVNTGKVTGSDAEGEKTDNAVASLSAVAVLLSLHVSPEYLLQLYHFVYIDNPNPLTMVITGFYSYLFLINVG